MLLHSKQEVLCYCIVSRRHCVTAYETCPSSALLAQSSCIGLSQETKFEVQECEAESGAIMQHRHN